MSSITSKAHPNLALIKYWGKSDREQNLPATPSIGISLEAFTTTTTIVTSDFIPGHNHSRSKSRRGQISWDVRIGNNPQDPRRYSDFFKTAAQNFDGPDLHLDISSENNFPTAAGLASSASGFAALAAGVSRALSLPEDKNSVSALARIGSGSAARSVFPGFVFLDRDGKYAESLHPEDHWEQLRCIIVQVGSEKKAVSSREAMESSRNSSPFYNSWVLDSIGLASRAKEALAQKNLDGLGRLMRRSYLRMFSTMFSCDEPVIYWMGESVQVIKTAEALRGQGMPIWETMDAGPQVKLITTSEYAQDAAKTLGNINSNFVVHISRVGAGAEARENEGSDN